MKNYFKRIMNENPRLRKVVGISFIVLGVVIHLIPFLPASWLIFIGLEVLGMRMIFQNKLKNWLHKIRLTKKII